MAGDDEMELAQLVQGMPECTICYEEYNTEGVIPRLIPVCGHCVCERCLDQLIKNANSAANRLFDCPTCRLQVRPLKKQKLLTLNQFPKNWTLLQCLAAVDAAEKRERNVFDPTKFGLDALPDGPLARLSSASTDLQTEPSESTNYWECPRCTLHNNLYDSTCSACEGPRPKRRRIERPSGSSASAAAPRSGAEGAEGGVGEEEEEEPVPAIDSGCFLARLERTY